MLSFDFPDLFFLFSQKTPGFVRDHHISSFSSHLIDAPFFWSLCSTSLNLNYTFFCVRVSKILHGIKSCVTSVVTLTFSVRPEELSSPAHLLHMCSLSDQQSQHSLTLTNHFYPKKPHIRVRQYLFAPQTQFCTLELGSISTTLTQ